MIRYLYIGIFCLFVSLALNGTGTDAALADIFSTKSKIWTDEFNNGSVNLFDAKKSYWSAKVKCDGYIALPECDNKRNDSFRLINGALAMAAVNKESEAEYAMAVELSSKEKFKFGRIEVRAALPIEKPLAVEIYLEDSACKQKGEIFLMQHDFNLDTSIRYGFTVHKPFYSLQDEYRSIHTTLTKFHTYALEWNGEEIKWSLDNINYHNFKLTKKSTDTDKAIKELFNCPRSLGIRLVMKNNNHDRLHKTSCSALVLDYVRVYPQGSYNHTIHNSEHDRISVDGICTAMNSRLQLEQSTNLVNVIEYLSVNLDKRLTKIENVIASIKGSVNNIETTVLSGKIVKVPGKEPLLSQVVDGRFVHCYEDGYIEHPTDKQKFIVCENIIKGDTMNRGRIHVMSCPTNTIWKQKDKTCEF